MSKLAVIASHNFNNKNLLEGFLDIYLHDDPDLSMAVFNHPNWGPDAWAAVWATLNGVDCNVHDSCYVARVPDFEDEELLRCNMDLICDCDEAVIFWDGTDESLIPTFDICKRQEKTQVILISNDETPCEIYTGETQ